LDGTEVWKRKWVRTQRGVYSGKIDFIDVVDIVVKAGDGGNGAVSLVGRSIYRTVVLTVEMAEMAALSF